MLGGHSPGLLQALALKAGEGQFRGIAKPTKRLFDLLSLSLSLSHLGPAIITT